MTTIDTSAPATVLPTSFLQEAWVAAAVGGRSDYSVPVAWTLDGPLDRAALGRALDGLMARHEALRSALDGATQRVLGVDAAPAVAVEDMDLRGDPERERTAARLVLAAARAPFALAHAPLWRALVLRLADERHVVALVFHHAIFDGWSTGVVLRDLTRLYGSDGGAPLPELALQPGDVAAWERTRPAAVEEQWWRRTLADPPARLDLPAAPEPDGPFRLVARPFPAVGAEAVSALERLARDRGTRLSIVLRAAVVASLAQWTAGGDVVVGLLQSNRRRPEVHGLIGALIDYAPLRVRYRPGTTFGGLVALVRDASAAAAAHPLALGRIAPDAGAAAAPFDVTINFLPHAGAPAPHASGVRFTTHPVPMTALRATVARPFPAAAPLSFVLRTTAAGTLEGDLYANEAAFGDARLDALGHRFAAVVAALARSPHGRFADAIDRLP